VRRRRISIWLMETPGRDPAYWRFVLSAKRKRGGYLRKTGWGDKWETKWDYYPLKPIEHDGFYFVGHL
jgi:hypothetical protein